MPLQKQKWSSWKSFPDPRKLQRLSAPIGFGVYQLYNSVTKEFILFGRGKNVATRMCSLLPKPFSNATRNNNDKRDYVLNNIEIIKYRTIAFYTEGEMTSFEKKLKQASNHLFNT